MGGGPGGDGFVAHTGAKRNAFARLLVLHQVERHERRFGGGADVAQGDAIGDEFLLGGQICVAGGVANFHHRHQLQIAIGIVDVGGAPLGGGDIGIGFAVNILHLPLAIPRPVKDVKCVPKLFGVFGTQLQINHDRFAASRIAHGKVEGGGVAKETIACCRGAGEGGEIPAVGDAVVIIVGVKEIRRSVAVGVQITSRHVSGRDRIGGWCAPTFGAVPQAIIVAVFSVRVGVPALAANQVAAHLNAIRQPIIVAIVQGWVAAKARFDKIGQAIVIEIGAIVGGRRPLAVAAGGENCRHLGGGEGSVVERWLIDDAIEVVPTGDARWPTGCIACTQLIAVTIGIGLLGIGRAAHQRTIQIEPLGSAIVGHCDVAKDIVVNRPYAGNCTRTTEHVGTQFAIGSHINGVDPASGVGVDRTVLLPQNHTAAACLKPKIKAKGAAATGGAKAGHIRKQIIR